ncbi:MAG: hypothetical protein K1X72_13445 [Pyrinomonadaceae bacterium]|nr:hypothetical protein [Pyrinomonadaceae bacterium]
MTEIEQIITAVKAEIPNIVVFKLNEVGAKPFEFGVWQFWLEDNKNEKISIEVQHGFCYACYSNIKFASQDELKYLDTAKWICKYLGNSKL